MYMSLGWRPPKYVSLGWRPPKHASLESWFGSKLGTSSGDTFNLVTSFFFFLPFLDVIRALIYVQTKWTTFPPAMSKLSFNLIFSSGLSLCAPLPIPDFHFQSCCESTQCRNNVEKVKFDLSPNNLACVRYSHILNEMFDYGIFSKKWVMLRCVSKQQST